jgi:hypothetical protein
VFVVVVGQHRGSCLLRNHGGHVVVECVRTPGIVSLVCLDPESYQQNSNSLPKQREILEQDAPRTGTLSSNQPANCHGERALVSRTLTRKRGLGLCEGSALQCLLWSDPPRSEGCRVWLPLQRQRRPAASILGGRHPGARDDIGIGGLRAPVQDSSSHTEWYLGRHHDLTIGVLRGATPGSWTRVFPSPLRSKAGGSLRRSHWWLLVGLCISKSQPINGHQRGWLPSLCFSWASGVEIDGATFRLSTAAR